MKKTLIVLSTVFALIAFGTALAQHDGPTASDPVVLTDEQGQYLLGLHIDILEDPGGDLTIEDVTSPEYASQFARSDVETPSFGLTDSAIWVRLPLRNEALREDHWLLEHGYANTHFIDLYTPLSDSEGYTVKQTGALRPVETRDLIHPNIVFDMDIPPGDEQQAYLRVESGSAINLPLTLWKPTEFLTNSARNQAVYALYIGILIGLLGYNLFLFVSLRESSYLYLVILLANMVFFEATYLGYLECCLLPSLYQFKSLYFPLSFALIFVPMILFADSFLELKELHPKVHWVNIAILGGWGLLILLIPFTNYHVIANVMVPWGLVSMAEVLVAGSVSWLRGFRPARYFMIAWFGLAVALSIALLVVLGTIPSTVFSGNAYRLGLVWMAICWSIALADRINILQAETESSNLALSNSEYRLSQILEGLPLGVVVYGKDSRPNYMNRRVFEILSNPIRGIQPDLSAQRTLEQAMEYFTFRVAGTDQHYQLDNMPVYRALRGDPASADDIEADLRDRRVPLEIWASPVKDDKGNVESAVVAFQDISRRKGAEAELVEYRDHLEHLVQQRTAELNEVNDHLHGEMTEREFLQKAQLKLIRWLSVVNQTHQSLGGTADLTGAYEQLLATIAQLQGAIRAYVGVWDSGGDPIQALCYRQPSDSSPLADTSPSLMACDYASLRRLIERNEILHLPVDQVAQLQLPLEACIQDDRILSVTLVPIEIHEAVVGLLVLGMPCPAEEFHDEGTELLERMALDLAHLAQYAHFLDQAHTLAAAEERNRLARDLHDSVTQVLFSATLVAEVLPKMWQRDQEKAMQSLERLRQLTHGALAEMRTMLLELRPAALVNTPLGDLLAQLTEAVTTRSGLSFQLSIDRIPSLPESVHTSFYRIAQEALNNVVKHAQANLVTLRLSATALPTDADLDMSYVARYEVTMEIQDDGVGYASSEDKAGHLGIGIMRERAGAIRADLSLASKPGRGTRVTMIWRDNSGVDYE